MQKRGGLFVYSKGGGEVLPEAEVCGVGAGWGGGTGRG